MVTPKREFDKGKYIYFALIRITLYVDRILYVCLFVPLPFFTGHVPSLSVNHRYLLSNVSYFFGTRHPRIRKLWHYVDVSLEYGHAFSQTMPSSPIIGMPTLTSTKKRDLKEISSIIIESVKTKKLYSTSSSISNSGLVVCVLL